MADLVSQAIPNYVIVGHITQDLTPQGKTLGGTALYSSVTACAIGLRVGVLTACHSSLQNCLPPGIQFSIQSSPVTTTFENIPIPGGRIQYIHSLAAPLIPDHFPSAWKNTPILHLGPVAQEVDLAFLERFSSALVGITPQGWMRQWDENGKVSYQPWKNAQTVMQKADIAIFSVEDVQGDEAFIEEAASWIKILVVTEGKDGARVYWNGDVRRFKAPVVQEIDSTGAGDVFAAAYFSQFLHTRDPWESARYANRIASISVTRVGLPGIPTPEEVKACLVEILPQE